MKKIIIGLLVSLFSTTLYAEDYLLKVVIFTQDNLAGRVLINKTVDVMISNSFQIQNLSCNASAGSIITCGASDVSFGSMGKNPLLSINFKNQSYVITYFKKSDTNIKGQLK